MIKSPVTDLEHVELKQEIKCDDLIKSYKDKFNIDVSRYFLGLKF